MLDVREQVLEILRYNMHEVFNANKEQVSLEEMDSIMLINIIVDLEETFEICIPNSKLEIGNFNTVDKIINIVTELVAE